MKMSSETSYKETEDFFEAPLTKNQKAWGLINKFYHLILTNMEKKGISRSQLAKQLNRSKASVSQLFNKTPNISILKMVEIANEVGVNLDIVDQETQKKLEQQKTKNTVTVITYVNDKQDEVEYYPDEFAMFSRKSKYTEKQACSGHYGSYGT